jgi:hypothetical protein
MLLFCLAAAATSDVLVIDDASFLGAGIRPSIISGGDFACRAQPILGVGAVEIGDLRRDAKCVLGNARLLWAAG